MMETQDIYIYTHFFLGGHLYTDRICEYSRIHMCDMVAGFGYFVVSFLIPL